MTDNWLAKFLSVTFHCPATDKDVTVSAEDFNLEGWCPTHMSMHDKHTFTVKCPVCVGGWHELKR